MKFYFLFLLIMVANFAKSQNEAVPNGIYATLSAMSESKPLKGYEVFFIKEPDSTDRWVGFNNLKILPKLKNAKENICGFSDGKDYYINSALYDPEGNIRYSRLLYKGKRFSYFMAVIRLGMPHQRSLVAIDMKHGRLIPLNKNVIRDFIADDKELLKEFNETANNKKDYAEFLSRYDQKHY